MKIVIIKMMRNIDNNDDSNKKDNHDIHYSNDGNL